MEPTVSRAVSSDELEKIYRLRVAAWQARVHSFPDIDRWTDAFDSVGHHWAIWEGSRPIAAARLTIHDRLTEVPNAEVFAPVIPATLEGPIGVLTRLVVDIDHGGRGLSNLLDIARIDYARAQGCKHMIGSTYAGQKRLNAMQALAFEIIGEAGHYADGPLRAVAGGGAGTAFLLRIR